MSLKGAPVKELCPGNTYTVKVSAWHMDAGPRRCRQRSARRFAASTRFCSQLPPSPAPLCLLHAAQVAFSDSRLALATVNVGSFNPPDAQWCAARPCAKQPCSARAASAAPSPQPRKRAQQPWGTAWRRFFHISGTQRARPCTPQPRAPGDTQVWLRRRLLMGVDGALHGQG